MFKKLFLLLLFFIVASPVHAASWPPEVKPEQGKASGSFTQAAGAAGQACTMMYTFTFWNVGETGGRDYGNTTFTAETTCTGSSKPDLETLQGVFSGGPNGKVTVAGFVFNLVNGTYFVTTDAKGKTHQFSVENPEIFSRYRWSMDESIPIPEIKEGKYEVETYDSSLRFSDLYGQVEVIIPNPDGTYDEDADWNLAKIDMELPPGTRIKVSEESGLMISFPNMTTIIVGPETEIILVSTDPQKSVMQLLYGDLKANVTKMMKDGSMQVEMSQAVAGIKGTRFILNETKTESSIRVTEGTVKFISKSTGVSVDVGKGESVTASSQGLSEKTTFDPAKEEEKWQELANGIKKTNPNIFSNKNTIYILGGIIITAIVIGFLLLKFRRHKK